MTNAATETQWETAKDVFVDRVAARQLVEETIEQESLVLERPLSIGQIRAMINGSGGTAAFSQTAQPIPLGAIRLYRAFLSREGLAFSRHARAASSDLVAQRTIGTYQLEFVMEDDALFITIKLDGNIAPRSLFLLDEEGQNHMIALDEPVEDTIQKGLARHDSANTKLIEMLLNPVTSMTLI